MSCVLISGDRVLLLTCRPVFRTRPTSFSGESVVVSMAQSRLDPTGSKMEGSYSNMEEFKAGCKEEGEESSPGTCCKNLLDIEEAKIQILFSFPAILTNLFFSLITLVSVMFAGHLGELQLAGAALANSWGNVTGFAFVVGLSGALETLCGQGFGSKSYRTLGIYLQASCFFIDSSSNYAVLIEDFASMTPLLAISIVLDSLQGVFSGVARGCGWQHLAVYVNLGTFYIIGMTIAGLLGFVLKLYAKGLWTGLICGLFFQASTLLLITQLKKWTSDFQYVKASSQSSEI